MVRVSDPAALGGLDGFNRELELLVTECQENPPADAGRPVRLPGSPRLERKKAALANGLTLHPDVEAQVRALAEEAAIPLPAPVTS